MVGEMVFFPNNNITTYESHFNKDVLMRSPYIGPLSFKVSLKDMGKYSTLWMLLVRQQGNMREALLNSSEMADTAHKSLSSWGGHL